MSYTDFTQNPSNIDNLIKGMFFSFLSAEQRNPHCTNGIKTFILNTQALKYNRIIFLYWFELKNNTPGFLSVYCRYQTILLLLLFLSVIGGGVLSVIDPQLISYCLFFGHQPKDTNSVHFCQNFVFVLFILT